MTGKARCVDENGCKVFQREARTTVPIEYGFSNALIELASGKTSGATAGDKGLEQALPTFVQGQGKLACENA